MVEFALEKIKKIKMFERFENMTVIAAVLCLAVLLTSRLNN